MRVGVVGAGIAGLAAARWLADRGHEVVVVEKSRGLGGRMAARRVGGTVVDHGIPAVELPGSGGLDDLVARFAAADRVAVERPVLGPGGRPEPPAVARYAWPAGMTRLPKAMAEGLDVLLGTRLATLRAGRDGIELGQDQGNTVGVVDAVVVSAPAPQAADLLERSPGGAERAERLRAVAYDPAVMILAGVRMDEPLEWFAMRPAEGPLLVVQDESAKSRAPREGVVPVVARLDPAASARLIDAADDLVLDEALPALAAVLGAPAAGPAWVQVKRWRYAVPRNRLTFDAVNGPGERIVVCGDAVAEGSTLDDTRASGERAARLLGPG